MHTLVETPRFISDRKAAGVSQTEYEDMLATIAADPDAGARIKGSGGARKLRIEGKGKGKSGGYRVVTYYMHDAAPVFLLALYSKGDRATLSAAEVNDLKETTAAIAKEYGT